MGHLLPLIALCLLSTQAVALSQGYDKGPTALGDNATLSWTLDNTTRRISLGLTIIDSAVLSKEGPAWLALGVSEETSGSMLGADIASVEFGSGVLTNCTLRDRYVPFSAFPLRESIPGAPSVYPNEDSCQRDGSWKLVACKRDLTTGTATLELERALEAHDDQDRPINAGSQALIYAYGGVAFNYHGKYRGSSRIVLFNEDGSYPSETDSPLPKDIAYTHTVQATNYSVPSANVTTYACTTSVVPLPKSGKRFLVAVEPIIKSMAGKNMAHHLLVYACKDTPYARSFFKTNYCMDDGPGGSTGQCVSLLYGWAVGAGRFVAPDGVGIEVDASNNYLIMETHYDNPGKAEGAIDVSGAKLHFADSRPILAGLLSLGDPAVSMFGRTVKNKFEYTSTCPSNCTSVFKEEINVISSQMHMHTTGRKIYTNRFDKDGNFIEPINTIEYWSNDHQMIREFKKPKKIAPGDILSTTCVFDTRKRPKTKFGLETKDEMCLEFLLYYPLQKRVQSDGAMFMCSMIQLRGNNTGTMCGSPDNRQSYSPQVNPSFNDTKDTPEKFGLAPTTCALLKGGGNSTSTETANNGTSATCFPGMSTVQTRNAVLRMSDLRIGDEVLVGDGTFSPVFMFTHRVPNGKYPFVQLRTDKHAVTLSHGHYIYTNGASHPAETVRVGDTLRGADGELEKVVHVRQVVEDGLYNPQTLHGDIVVNGIRTTTYTETVHPRVAHALLVPMRALMEAFGWTTAAFERDQYAVVRAFNGIRSFART